MLLPDESPRAAGLDPLRKLLVVLRTSEDNRELGTHAGHRVTDREAVVVPKMDVDQHGVRLMPLYGLHRTGGTARLRDHVVAARREASACDVPEDRLVIHDDDLHAPVVSHLRALRAGVASLAVPPPSPN